MDPILQARVAKALQEAASRLSPGSGYWEALTVIANTELTRPLTTSTVTIPAAGWVVVADPAQHPGQKPEVIGMTLSDTDARQMARTYLLEGNPGNAWLLKIMEAWGTT